MAVYHYRNSSLIERVDVTPLQPGMMQATIHLHPHAPLGQLHTLRQHLGEKDYASLMDTNGAAPVLQVRGVTNPEKLLAALSAEGVTEKEATPDDHQNIGFWDRLKQKSYFLAAVFYDIGNVSYLASGIQRGRHNEDGKFTANDISELMIGATFSVGDILMTAYGHTKGDEELQAAAGGLVHHLAKQGVAVPQGDVLHPDTNHRSDALKATNHWLRNHITQVKCASEFTGGLFTIHAALKKGNRNNGKLAAGFFICIGWLTTFLLDKPPAQRMLDGDTHPHGVVEHIKENPRAWVARPLAIFNNISNIVGSLWPKTGERARFLGEVEAAQTRVAQSPTPENQAHLRYTQVKQKDYGWNVVSAVSFMIGHLLFGLSGGKRPAHAEQDQCLTDDLVLMSANLLATQPQNQREASVATTAEYVSKLSHVTLDRGQLEGAIREKIKNLSQSTWHERVTSTEEPVVAR